MPRYENPPYYISAYGLAVKRGFKGTLDEWLASLKGKDAPPDVYLPLEGGVMRGDLDMGGFRLYNMKAPADYWDVVNKGYVDRLIGTDKTLTESGKPADAAVTGQALKDKAPAGYGLGTTAKAVESMDEAVGNGFYYSENGGPHQDYWYAICHNFDSSDNWVIQQAWNNIASEVANVSAVRRKCNGVWHDWEYENPPMYLGKEYKTTQRWQASPVYVWAVEVNSLPNNAAATVTVGASDVFAPVGLDLSLKRKSDGVRYCGHQNVSAYLTVINGELKLNISATGDMSGFTGYAIVRYVKN